MAELNSRVDSFISLLLDVSGRARLADLEAHTRTDAAELLQAYVGAHGERPLVFDGETLAYAAAPEPTAALEPEPVFEAPAPEPVFEAPAGEPMPVDDGFRFDASAIPAVEVGVMPGDGAAAPVDLSSLPEVVPADAGMPPFVEAPTQAGEPAVAIDAIPAVEVPQATSTPVSFVDEDSFFEFGPEPAPAPVTESVGVIIPDILPVPETSVAPEIPELPVTPEIPEIPMIPQAVPEVSPAPLIAEPGTATVPPMSDVPELVFVPVADALDDVPEMPMGASPAPVPSDPAVPEILITPLPVDDTSGPDLDVIPAITPLAIDDEEDAPRPF